MRKNQLQRREQLLLKLKSARELWAPSTESDFIREVESIIPDLRALALEADATSREPLERARTWRCLADACLEAVCGQDPEKLKRALEFYGRAEDLMQGVENSQERMLLEYGFGRALLGAMRCGDLSVVEKARERFARAQAIARFQDPELNELIRRALMHVQVISNLIRERRELWREIELREKSRKESDGTDPGRRQPAPEDAALFERLLKYCDQSSRKEE